MLWTFDKLAANGVTAQVSDLHLHAVVQCAGVRNCSSSVIIVVVQDVVYLNKLLQPYLAELQDVWMTCCNSLSKWSLVIAAYCPSLVAGKSGSW